MVRNLNPVTFDRNPGGDVDRDFRPRHPSATPDEAVKDYEGDVFWPTFGRDADGNPVPEGPVDPEVQPDPAELVTPPVDGIAAVGKP